MEAKKNSLMIVDDEKSNIMALSHILSEYHIYVAKNGGDAIELANEHLPDVILLDIIMPEMSGYDVIVALKNSEKTRDIPVIFITGLNDAWDEEKGLYLGAADYISKPFSATIVKLRVENQIRMLNYMKTVEQLCMTDQLTNISNRRAFDERLQMEWDRAIRNKTSISILIIDLDGFKAYNDAYGHMQGDKMLQAVAKTLMHELKRSVDFVARWGGDEFAVLLINTTCDDAMKIAESVRTSVANTETLLSNNKTSRITISIGINTLIPTSNCSLDDFVCHADKALYNAKTEGRNRICR